MANWVSNSVHCAILALVICSILFSTAARRDTLDENSGTDRYKNSDYNSMESRFDSNRHSSQNHLNTYNINFISGKDTFKKIGDSSVSKELSKKLADLQHNLKYHKNDFKYFADNSTSTTDTGSSTTSTSSSTNASEYKESGSFPWLMIVLILVCLILIRKFSILKYPFKLHIYL